MGSRRWNFVTKIIIAAVLAVLLIVVLVTFRAMIAPTVVALLLAFILSYPVNWIQRSTGWTRGAAVAVVYVGLVTLIILTPVLFFPRSSELYDSLRVTLNELVASLQGMSSGSILAFGVYRISLDSLAQQAGNALQNIVVVATQNPLSIAREVTNGVIFLVYVLVLNFWVLKDLHKFQRMILDQIPADYQEDARRLGQELGQVWHAFLRGQAVVGLVVGTMVWISLTIVGMPNAGGLALLAGVMEFLPSVGPAISGTIGTTVALFQGSSWSWLPGNNIVFAIIVSVIYAIIGQIESIYIIPRFVGGQVKLHPAVIFVGIISGAVTFGFLGILLAAPVIASVRTILSYIYRKMFDLEPFEPLGGAQAGVRIPGLIAGRKIEGVIFDLDGVLTVPDWSAAEWAATHLSTLDRLISPEDRRQATRRLMIRIEGTINFLDSQLRRFRQEKLLHKTQATFDRLRGYPPAEEFQPMPGSLDLIYSLQGRYQTAIVTARSQGAVDCYFVKAGIPRHLFGPVISRDRVRNLLPHSEPLLHAAKELGLAPEQALVVSDTDSGLRSARAAQMATAGVLSGLSREEDLTEADVTVATPAELSDWL